MMGSKAQAGKSLVNIITSPFISALLDSPKTTHAQAQELLTLAHANKCADKHVFRAYAGFFARAGDFRAIEDAMERMRAQGVKYDANVLTALASAYHKNKMSDLVVSTVQRIVDEKLNMNAKAASLMIHELSQRGDLAEVIRWYSQMRHARLQIDVDVFKSVMRVIADKGEYAEFAGVMNDMHQLNIYADKVLCSDILRFYTRLGYTEGALEYMNAQGFAPSRAAYDAIVTENATQSSNERAEKERLARDMVAYGSAHGMTPLRAAYDATIVEHVKNNDAAKLESVVGEMAQRGVTLDVGDYNVRMRAWAAQGNAAKCEELGREMEERGVKPDLYTIGSILSCYANNTTSESAKKASEWWKKMKKLGLAPNTKTYNLMLKIHTKMQWVDASMKLLEEMKERKQVDIITYNTLIHMFLLRGDSESVEKMRKEIENSGLIPDRITYMCLLKLLTKKRRTKEIEPLREEMKARGVKMDVHMYTSLIDMYGKGKDTEECKRIWEEMKRERIEPTEITVQVYKKYVYLDPKESKKT